MTASLAQRRERRRLLAAGAKVLAAAGIESPRLEVELLLGSVLGASRLDLLLMRPDGPVASDVRRKFAALVRARADHQPLAYLLGAREFYGRELRVDSRVLVPRPETEGLVQEAAAWLRGRPVGGRRAADVGTGSGCIAISLAFEVPDVDVVATDLSPDALEVARANASRLGAAVSFRHGDLLEALAGEPRFDLVVSNPPYVAPEEIGDVDRSVKEWEPRGAWLSERGALWFHRRILAGARAVLAPGGAVMMEVGSGAAELALEAATLLPGARARVVHDLAGHARIVVVEAS